MKKIQINKKMNRKKGKDFTTQEDIQKFPETDIQIGWTMDILPEELRERQKDRKTERHKDRKLDRK